MGKTYMTFYHEISNESSIKTRWSIKPHRAPHLYHVPYNKINNFTLFCLPKLKKNATITDHMQLLLSPLPWLRIVALAGTGLHLGLMPAQKYKHCQHLGYFNGFSRCAFTTYNHAVVHIISQNVLRNDRVQSILHGLYSLTKCSSINRC